MAYVLVKCFENNKIVEATIPKHWMEGHTMWWPAHKARQLAISLAPLDKNWKSFPVLEVKRSSDNFEELETGSYTTTEAEDSPVKKKPSHQERNTSQPQFAIESSLPSLPGAATVSSKQTAEENSFQLRSPVLGKVTTKGKPRGNTSLVSPVYNKSNISQMVRSSFSPTTEQPSNANNAFIPILPGFNSQGDQSLISTTMSSPVRQTSKYPSAGGHNFKEMNNKHFQYTIMMEFQRLSQNQDRILSLLQNSNMDTEESDDTGDQILVASSSMEEFKKEELELKQSSKKRKIKRRLIRQLSSGKPARKALLSALDSLMTRAVQGQFSKAGKKGKLNFQDTHHYTCIMNALQEKYKDNDLDWMIGDIMKHAPKEKKRKEQQKSNGKEKKRMIQDSGAYGGGACGNARDDDDSSDDD
ncbi:uncharacterized protein [Clytia hemisphaerica]